MDLPRVSLPRKTWIGTYEFPMRAVPPTDSTLDGDDGCMISEEGKRGIYIANNLDPRKVLEIVKHEITHAINWVYDVEDGADEEHIARAHGEAWSQFFLDNPRYQRWLTAMCNAIRRERSNV